MPPSQMPELSGMVRSGNDPQQMPPEQGGGQGGGNPLEQIVEMVKQGDIKGAMQGLTELYQSGAIKSEDEFKQMQMQLVQLFKQMHGGGEQGGMPPGGGGMPPQGGGGGMPPGGMGGM
tara:strand:+ start:1713 stop:2066 length:354 start_codon:yes stop_codon:yes gene_type:complete